jgi:hypothetical protein
MKGLGNLIALIGVILFGYTVFARFYGQDSILGLPQVPGFAEGFTATGMFSGISCLLLIAVILILNTKH